MMSSMLASRVMPVNPITPQPMSPAMTNFLRFMAQEGRTGVGQGQAKPVQPVPPQQGMQGPNVGRMLPDPNRVPAPNLGALPPMMQMMNPGFQPEL